MFLFLRIMANEIYKGLCVCWYYKFNMATEFATLCITFIGTLFLMNLGQLDAHSFSSSLVGYVVYIYASVILDSSYTLMLERRGGTLEPAYMSPALPAFIFLGNVIAVLLWNTAMIVFMSIVLMAVFRVYLTLTFASLIILLIIILGLLGVGLAVAGAALIYKNISGTINLANNILFYINGTMLPIDYFPPWLQTLANTLPTTDGIIVLRKAVLNHISLLDLAYEGSLLPFIGNSLAYFALGWFIFSWCEWRAKTQGIMGQY